MITVEPEPRLATTPGIREQTWEREFYVEMPAELRDNGPTNPVF
jgi:hypothetical protein